MPVILDPGTEEMKKWLDPKTTTWSRNLQSILKPYEGELECYPVPKEVGKVGNNSPDFIVPVNSKENKSNIANFFDNAKKKGEKHSATSAVSEPAPKQEPVSPEDKVAKEERATHDHEWSEDNAPKPIPAVKREHSPEHLSIGEDSKKHKMDSKPTGPSPQKKKLRSATHNSPTKKPSDAKANDGSQRITNFFKK
jgi:hypothetical protein